MEIPFVKIFIRSCKASFTVVELNVTNLPPLFTRSSGESKETLPTESTTTSAPGPRSFATDVAKDLRPPAAYAMAAFMLSKSLHAVPRAPYTVRSTLCRP
jgi:hypothetical protein